MKASTVSVASFLALLHADWVSGQEQGRPFPLPPSDWPETIDDEPLIGFVLLDRAEYQEDDDASARLWDVQGWVGGDWNKFWFKTEGVDEAAGEEEIDLELLYARRIAPFWHLQAGIRHDFEPGPSRSYIAVGVQGLGLYWFEVEATTYLSDEGEASARLEAEYDLPFTQRLVLQPRLETSVYGSDVEEFGIEQGFNELRIGLRLRYEIRRELAPYVGVEWIRQLGDTADLAESIGEDVESMAIVAGIRAWF